MIHLPSKSHTTALVVGLGRAGKACVASLQESGACVYTWDDHNRESSSFTEDVWPLIDYLVVSPGIPHTTFKEHPLLQKARQQGIPCYSDIELLAQESTGAFFIGITGTNGKTTTTSLVHAILSTTHPHTVCAGNIGTPVLSLDPFNTDTVCVLELSSFQLDLISTPFLHVGAILNIRPDHLDAYGQFSDYVKAKHHICDLILPNGYCIVDTTDPLLKDITPHVCYNKLDLDAALAFPLHMRKNVKAAITIAKHHSSFEETKALAAVHSFTPPPHRQQCLFHSPHLTIVNDSKATNVHACIQALSSYRHIIWIAGGIIKEEIHELAAYMKYVEHSCIIGSNTAPFENLLKGKPYTVCSTMENAVHTAFKKARDLKEACILLSPSAASYDQYKSYEHRGHHFIELINEYLHAPTFTKRP